MRILVLSDIHGDLHSAMRAVKAQPNAEAIIFCGDGAQQFQSIKETYPEKTVVGVRGNCDWTSTLPVTETITLGGKTLFITHGHMYQAKFTTYNLVCAAREAKADILLFGHTHQAEYLVMGDVTLFNPGAAGARGSGGLITLEGGAFQCRRIEL